MSELQTAITNLQLKHSELAAAVKSYPGTVASAANAAFGKASVEQRKVRDTVRNLRKRIENDGQSLILDWEYDVAVVNGEGRNLSEVVTFSRSTGGGRFGPDGKYEWVPATRTNLQTWSEDTSQSGWVRSGVAGIGMERYATGGFEGHAYTTLTVPQQDAQAYLRQPNVVVSGQRVTYSLAVRARSTNKHTVLIRDITNSTYPACTISIKSGPGSVTQSPYPTVENLSPDAWTVIQVTTDEPLSATVSLWQFPDRFTGQAVGASVDISRPQLETGTKATDYIPTLGSPVTIPNTIPRIDYDPETGECRGLLVEEQRTNLLTGSRDFSLPAWKKTNMTVQPSSVVSPSGLADAQKIVAGGSGAGFIYQEVDGVPVATRTQQSVYAKAAEFSTLQIVASSGYLTGFQNVSLIDGSLGAGDFDSLGFSVKAVNVGNGWWRVTAGMTTGGTHVIRRFLITAVASKTSGRLSTSDNDGVSGILVWGPQFEVGSFPTSYIPTEGTAVTRAADMVYLASVEPWFNRSEGTFYMGVVVLDEAPTATRMLLYETGTSRFLYRVAPGGMTPTAYDGENTARVTPPGLLRFPERIASSYSSADFRVAAAGYVSAEVSGGEALRNVTMLHVLGRENGHVKRLEYFPRALTESELQELTSL